VRATVAFCDDQGALWAALLAPFITYLTTDLGMGFAKPMMMFTTGALVCFVVALPLGREALCNEMTADLEIMEADETP
jgi:hypothetical protein